MYMYTQVINMYSRDVPRWRQRLVLNYHLLSLDESVRVLAQVLQFVHKPLIFHEALSLVTLSQSVHHISSTERIIHLL